MSLYHRGVSHTCRDVIEEFRTHVTTSSRGFTHMSRHHRGFCEHVATSSRVSHTCRDVIEEFCEHVIISSRGFAHMSLYHRGFCEHAETSSRGLRTCRDVIEGFAHMSQHHHECRFRSLFFLCSSLFFSLHFAVSQKRNVSTFLRFLP